MRKQYDCTHDHVHDVKAVIQPGDMVALYVTGSPDIRATAGDIALFNGHQITTIDQGFTGSPVKTATVRDVERGAWTLHDAINEPWEAERKTLYLSRSLIPSAQEAGWHGDVWLAEWEAMPTIAPHFTGLTVVAQQWANLGPYDLSVVWDTTWPKAMHPVEILSVTPYPGYIHVGWREIPGATSYELLIVGAGGAGTGTDYMDKEFMSLNAGKVPLAPGWYIARVRPLYGRLRGDWSAAKHFEVPRA